MKTLYLECRMGAAGDMLTAALSELVDQKKFIDHMNSIGLEGVTFSTETSVKCGITGTHVTVKINGEEEESHDEHHHHDHHHEHHHDHAHNAVFVYRLENLKTEDAHELQHRISHIHDISDVTLSEGVLRYSYDHDHNDHAEEHIREILADFAGVELVSLGHEHHHEHHHDEHDHDHHHEHHHDHEHDHHHEHHHDHEHGHHHDHAHPALYAFRLEGLTSAKGEEVLEKIKGIHDISEVSLNCEEGTLKYVYDHDHGAHAEEHVREILTQYAPEVSLTSLGHEHDHGHGHHHLGGMHGVQHILAHLNISDQVRRNAEAVYQLIAEAESHAHNMPVDQVHFHEVGTMDAVADVVAVCTLMEWLDVERVYASPVAVGNGMVRCAHGILPVPAPATAYLLRGIPSYSGRMQGELCTPTGAALLKHFVQSFESMPVMVTEKIGYGMGKKDFEAANCVRAFLGETEDDGEVTELVCNLDDISAEAVGFAVDELFAAGALDVYTTAVHMKKNRPGIVFTCMCRTSDKDKMIALMFKHLTTLGIRDYTCRRHALKREVFREETSLGSVRRKRSTGFGTVREKLEFEDLAAIAREKGLSVEEIRRLVEAELSVNK